MQIDGMKVVDAKKKVTIVITKADVKNGETKDPAGCAAARACMRDLEATAARVHLGRTYVKIDNKWIRFHTPSSLRSEIIAFDRGGSFAPGKYVLPALQPAKKTGRRQGSMTNTQPKRRKRARPYHITTGVREHGANR